MKERALESNPIFWFYGSAATAFGIKNHAFSYLLLIFSTQVLGIDGYKAAIALAIAMLWDAVTDLLLGHWSDKTRSRYGRRHPFMYAALLILPISFWAMFNPVIELTDDFKFAYLLVFALLIRTGTTLFEVPSVALLPELEVEYHRRSRWLALRQAFGWYGGNGIHTINMMAWVGFYGMAEQTGYSIYAAAGASLIALSIIVSSLGTQKFASALPPPKETFRIREISIEIKQIFSSLRDRSFLSLFTYGVIVGMAGGLSTALYLYNTTYFFGFSGAQIAVTGLAVFIAPLLTYFLIPIMSLFWGKKPTAIAAITFAVSLYPIPYVLSLAGWWPEFGSNASLALYTLFIVVEVTGFVTCATLLDSMTADIVEESEVHTARRSEGLFYAARGFGSKAISAGGIIFAGMIVSIVGMEGFETATDMTREHRIQLASFFLPLYCGLHVFAVYMLTKYKINKSDHEANLENLAARRSANKETQTAVSDSMSSGTVEVTT